MAQQLCALFFPYEKASVTKNFVSNISLVEEQMLSHMWIVFQHCKKDVWTLSIVYKRDRNAASNSSNSIEIPPHLCRISQLYLSSIFPGSNSPKAATECNRWYFVISMRKRNVEDFHFAQIFLATLKCLLYFAFFKQFLVPEKKIRFPCLI